MYSQKLQLCKNTAFVNHIDGFTKVREAYMYLLTCLNELSCVVHDREKVREAESSSQETR